MKYEKYVSLIEHLENYAAKNPKSYQYRVIGLALLGYSYIVGLILVCILLPLLFLAVLLISPGVVIRIFLLSLKLWWILLPGAAIFGSFLIGAIRSLTAKVPEPVGDEIERADAAKLFEFVERTCVELKAERPEKILVNDEFNASVVTVPRFGIFGRKVYLNLGLPLMYALSPEQFQAVLTHEIGHISGRHGTFSKWAYQLHETWRRFIESQELQQHKLSALYEKFVNWFFPYFSAYLFVLMRKHEREADDYTVQLVGAKPLGEALINLEVKGKILSQNFWQEVFEENTRQDKPPTELFSRMATTFRRQDNEKETQSLIKFVAVKTDYSDTHPSLAERLKASGYWTEGDLPQLPALVKENAAEIYLGNSLERYAQKFNREWQEKISQNWKANFDYLQNVQKRLEELSEKEELSAEELFEKAGLVAERQGNAAALPLVRRLLEIQPEHAEANYILGGILLENDDESGFEYLNKAMHLDTRWKLPASEVAFNYLRIRGRHEEAKSDIETIENQQEVVQKAQKERSTIHPTDNFEPHRLSDELLESITKKISYHDEIASAHIVCKTVQYFPEIPLHVLFLTLKNNLPKGVGAVSAQDVVDTIGKQAGELGIEYIYAFGKNDEQYKNKIAAIEKSKIFGE
jgi:Zn-dependent protease with chaperone function